MTVISDYLKKIEQALQAGNATEHTYRPALKALVEAIAQENKLTVTATNEPKRVKCGAPDYIVTNGQIPLGYIEAKDVDIPLVTIEKGEQMGRYLGSLGNLILTDYLEFRWYVEGEHRITARLATVGRNNKLHVDAEGAAHVAELLLQFLRATVPTISKPKELAIRMAALTHLLRDAMTTAFEDEGEQGGLLHDQLKSFREVLIHDLQPANFADMYAQTICYGLFTARCNMPLNEEFTRWNSPRFLPKTNPFLRKMFTQIAGPELDDEPFVWVVNDLADLLSRVDIGAILENFGKRTRQQDPVVHFYETFLAAYNPKMREMRGVYYTPEPVVSYIVRSVDYLLKTEFNLPDGLADTSKVTLLDRQGNEREVHQVQILDPATGTGTFLHGVIDQIYQHLTEHGQIGMWNSYVSTHLLPRLFGFELLMAPYAVAHMKLGLQLAELGYDFHADERLRIYLTNTLQEAFELPPSSGFTQWLTAEASEANKVKQALPILVVLGNPPYSGHSANKGKWISELLHGVDWLTGKPAGSYFEVDGNPLGEKNPKWLNDDYVKFIRFAQWRIEQTGYGIIAFITNNGYLDNPTFRGMRQSLLHTFDEIYILNLHGNSKKKEVTPDGEKDENVFDIMQGVAIGIFVKQPGKRESKYATIHHADVWGRREDKYSILLGSDIANTNWVNLSSHTPHYLFKQHLEELSDEYNSYCPVTSVFPINNMGVTTGDDGKYIAYSACEIIDHFSDKDKVFNIAYRPFDSRWVYYDPTLLARARFDFMHHLTTNDNIALATLRRPRNEMVGNFFITNRITDKCVISSLDNAQIFPLYLYPDEKPKTNLFEMEEMGDIPGRRRPNIAIECINDFSQKLAISFTLDGKGDLQASFGPEDIFDYFYAVVHAPTYRSRYAEFLKIDFPRLPLTSNIDLFRTLCELGDKLVGLHVMERKMPLITRFPVAGNNLVDKISYSEPHATEPGRVWINKTQYIEGVTSEVWAFHVGGYQVCEKWLKDRKGRLLTYDDLTYYQHVVAALAETMRIMQEIDNVIDAHGGWPIL